MTNRLLSAQTDYPIHIGVTESGTARAGVIRSSAGIGSLLCDGIGDTIRISLSADPVKEIEAARILMAACGLRGAETVEIIACPTCGRTRVPVMEIAAELEKRIAAAKLKPKRRIRVAVMGCAVNGPGEAREADAGIAGGDGEALLFRKGKIIEKISCRDGSQSASNRLMEEIRRIIEEDNG
ncbi:4-hydroxy-3-methylbut-2-en-1-yl diphosphate synthase (flavodoxin) [bioreactor metagenome]|uniref:4-hydroxy-3-methylbut-2-en-1-yl diphosphate synthase (Flavodoxin) n=1 Tax=bioreactor metagenome TaxID=1076179 RepID=A0A645G9P0_9ZZZZ